MRYTVYVFILLWPNFTGCQSDDRIPSNDKTTILKDSVLQQLMPVFAQKGVIPGDSVLIRVFKQEKELELWVAKDSGLVLLKTFPVCAASGKPGPKRKEGDLQVPEGFYTVDYFNPDSDYHLSFRVNYPNEADRFFADAEHPGGDIFIHGHCASIGCVAIRDKPIEFVFTAALLAAEKGQHDIPVHIFPCRMEKENLRLLNIAFPQHNEFWNNLQQIYDRFETKPEFFPIGVRSENGRYFIEKE